MAGEKPAGTSTQRELSVKSKLSILSATPSKILWGNIGNALYGTQVGHRTTERMSDKVRPNKKSTKWTWGNQHPSRRKRDQLRLLTHGIVPERIQKRGGEQNKKEIFEKMRRTWGQTFGCKEPKGTREKEKKKTVKNFPPCWSSEQKKNLKAKKETPQCSPSQK